MKVHKILLATDFSEEARPALRLGGEFARRFGAEVHLLTVMPSLPVEMPYFDLSASEVDSESAAAVARSLLADEVVRLGLEDLEPICVCKNAVRVATALTEYAADEKIDLIFMGTHGRSGFRRLLLGSVAAEVACTAPCSVVTANATSSETLAEGVVVVAVDFSPSSKAVLSAARAIQEEFGARIQVVHAVAEPIAFAEYGPQMLPDMAGILKEAKMSLDKLVTEQWPNPSEREQVEAVVLRGRPEIAICDHAEAAGANLVVVATRGRSALPRFLLGSTADRVIRGASMPVLTIFGES